MINLLKSLRTGGRRACPPGRRRILAVITAAVAVVAAAAGVTAAVVAATTGPGVTRKAGHVDSASGHAAAAGRSRSVPSIGQQADETRVSQADADADPPAPARSADAATIPERLQIPAIGVDSTLQALGVEQSGELQPPNRWQRAGWYAAGVHPGDTGPAVIAGHVDSASGPAVFFRLRSLRAGTPVYVTRADGTRLTFTVDGSADYPKRTFPAQAVYGPTSQPVLRLITCTGDFDYRTGSYLDNLVVSSHLVSGSAAGVGA